MLSSVLLAARSKPDFLGMGSRAHDEHTSNPSTLKAHFMWGIHMDMMAFTSAYDEERAMSLADVRSMLEHYLDWA